MHRVIQGLIVLVGFAVLALLFLVRGERPCESHPFFTLIGTSADCAAREVKPVMETVTIVAKAE